MRNDKQQKAIEEIRENGRVTEDIRLKYFEGMKFPEIREWLEEKGLDRHMILELCSTEIAIVTPAGILMQIRPLDNNQLGVWGGVIEDGEDPITGAIREVREETGIIITKEQLQFIESNQHYHKYSNGDQADFTTFRYVVKLEYIPKITTDEESVGVFMLVGLVIDHQRDFIKNVLKDNPISFN